MDQPGNGSEGIRLQDFGWFLPESFRWHRNILATRPRSVTNGKCEFLLCRIFLAIKTGLTGFGYNAALQSLGSNPLFFASFALLCGSAVLDWKGRREIRKAR